MLTVEVKVQFRDDTEESFLCYDSPYVSSEGVTIYGELSKSHFSRKFIPKEAIKNIEWDYIIKVNA